MNPHRRMLLNELIRELGSIDQRIAVLNGQKAALIKEARRQGVPIRAIREKRAESIGKTFYARKRPIVTEEIA